MKVVVIGAGFGGLAAAQTLLSDTEAVSVVILEASDRPGGRARTGQVTGCRGYGGVGAIFTASRISGSSATPVAQFPGQNPATCH